MSIAKEEFDVIKDKVIEDERENESSPQSRDLSKPFTNVSLSGKSGSMTRDERSEDKHITMKSAAGKTVDMTAARSSDRSGDAEGFNFEEGKTDEVREKFEIIGIKMDLHKNGTLYLKELVKLSMNQPKT